ncbi:MAG: hypothetical protein ACREQ2_00260 [Candidatus Binatia bacterium]
MRGLHTGEALGFLGQTVASLASLGGCFLVWTGMVMAWRRYRFWQRKGVHHERVDLLSNAEDHVATAIHSANKENELDPPDLGTLLRRNS